MSSDKQYLDYILQQLSPLEGITYRMMMGEYIIYYKGKIAAYVCDDRLLVKPVEAAKRLMPDAEEEPPYEGAKPMLLVTELDDEEFLCRLFDEMYAQLPPPKQKKEKD